MKNKEKYAKEILDIACSGNSIAMVKESGHIAPCYGTPCVECLFNGYKCKERVREWAESEYIEKPVISKRDRAFLDFIMGKYEYIVRDRTGYLYAYSVKPDKRDILWEGNGCEYFGFNNRIEVDFPMVKWSDSEPWFIEDLKKLEVVEEYENMNMKN